MSKLLPNRVNKPGSSLSGPNLNTLDESEENEIVENNYDEVLMRSQSITPARALVDASGSTPKTPAPPPLQPLPLPKFKLKRASSLVPTSVINGRLSSSSSLKKMMLLPSMELSSALSGTDTNFWTKTIVCLFQKL